MPPRVYKGRSAFEFKPKAGGTVKLCALDATNSAVWHAYEKLIEISKASSSVNALVHEFFDSADFRELAMNTQKDYIKYSKKVLAAFGSMQSDKVQPKHVRQFMDILGQKSPVQANRHKAFLSRTYRWAFERGKVTSNPCVGVKQFKETPRDRYVEDYEYQAVYNHACAVVKAAMEISYLCMARKADVVKLHKGQLLEQGIYIKQGKTGKKQIKEWGPRLRAAVTFAKAESGKVESMYVLQQKNGSPFALASFDQRWRKAVIKARLETELPLDFTFHDLKAKGISDFEGTTAEKQRASGHKSESQISIYDRKVQVVPTVESKK
ncbi:MAG: tyrosine-type recombinase/integrase [Paraglaciecola polaris]|uniref:tyrosine-type recombinase/integrase n=1 Tax=Paraglaciecola polaris TaxID=222814 RepID=UPI003003A4C9